MLTFADKQTAFIANTPSVNAQTEADYLLSDNLHRAKNIRLSNFRTLLESFSHEFTRVEAKLQELVDEYYPPDTSNLIEEWERALGIPDGCFKVENVTLEFRRKQVIAKLALMNLTTTPDFVELAAFFGVQIIIKNGSENGTTFPFEFPSMFFLNDKDAKFTMIVVFLNIPQPTNLFPFTFPASFEEKTLEDFILCLFEQLAPAPVRVEATFKP